MIRFIFVTTVCFLSVVQAEILRVGIFQEVINDTVPKKDFILGTTVMMKEITAEEGVETEIIYYDDAKKLGNDFNKGKIDYIAADALAISQHIPISNLTNGVMSFKKNKLASQTLLVVGLSDDQRPIKDKLAGSIASDGDACAELYIKTKLLQNGIARDPDFIPTKNPQQSILKLFFKKADLAILDRSSFDLAAELNPQIKQKLTILESTHLTIGPIAYMRKGISPSLQEKIIRLAKRLNTTPRGKQMLQLFRASQMDNSNVADLENVYALHQEYLSLKKPSASKAGKSR